jgi:uncharacterized protein DUF1524
MWSKRWWTVRDHSHRHGPPELSYPLRTLLPVTNWQRFRRLPAALQVLGLVVLIALVALLAVPASARQRERSRRAAATSTTITSTTSTTASSSQEPGTPSGDLLARLRVAPEGARTGYDRDLFPHWVDADHDRCDTREEVLVAESTTPAKVDPYSCKVLAGDWFSLYDGKSTKNPAGLQVDHVVALAEAWDSGAAGWDTARRRAFANDLDEPAALIAVTGSSNQSKSDHDPAEWRPPRRQAWCAFATDWMTVKAKWDLTADEEEMAALRELLATC